MPVEKKRKKKKKKKKAYGCEIWNFYGSFSNDIMAVKGLTILLHLCFVCVLIYALSNCLFVYREYSSYV